MPVPKNKKELQAFLGIINYLSKFSPDMLEVCKPLRKLTSSKAMWMWDASYQQWFEKVKLLIKVEMCMKFYDDTKLLYLKTDASGIGLGAALLQCRDNTVCQKGTVSDNTILQPIAFVSKSLTGAKWRYSNIECKVDLIRCMLIPFFGEVVSREGIQLDLRKIGPLTKCQCPKTKRNCKLS